MSTESMPLPNVVEFDGEHFRRCPSPVDARRESENELEWTRRNKLVLMWWAGPEEGSNRVQMTSFRVDGQPHHYLIRVLDGTCHDYHVWIRSLHAYVAFLNLPLVSALRTRED